MDTRMHLLHALTAKEIDGMRLTLARSSGYARAIHEAFGQPYTGLSGRQISVQIDRLVQSHFANVAKMAADRQAREAARQAEAAKAALIPVRPGNKSKK